ncbi:hypothetical protein Salmuc_01114 [Salipiger mucosus DSM 16094]|uniref:Uncharacterized protein n=1 Tax=Salipiger mucosus DSM 16094 TaxID=1123237 RepID=S9QZQ7_9RHOB|nr:hypothetical protein Salmuc_01114 [Salipiger mucosus DSM 16094]
MPGPYRGHPVAQVKFGKFAKGENHPKRKSQICKSRMVAPRRNSARIASPMDRTSA